MEQWTDLWIEDGWVDTSIDRLSEYMNRQMKDGWVGRWRETEAETKISHQAVLEKSRSQNQF